MNTRGVITKILQEAKAGRLGAMSEHGDGCVYESEDGHHCAIGCLFTPEKIETIQTEGLNTETSAAELYAALPSLFADIELTSEQAQTLQNWHDSFYAEDNSNNRAMIHTSYRKDDKLHYAAYEFEVSDFATIMEMLLSGEITRLRENPEHSAYAFVEFNLGE